LLLGSQMIDSIMLACVAAMTALALYIVAHDVMGVTNEMIWQHSLAVADVLGVALTARGFWST
jgi:hypothetical protein